jgi:hypothetical protein
MIIIDFAPIVVGLVPLLVLLLVIAGVAWIRKTRWADEEAGGG